MVYLRLNANSRELSVNYVTVIFSKIAVQLLIIAVQITTGFRLGTTHGTPLLRTDFLIKDVVVTLLCKIKAKGKSVDNGRANNAFALTARQLPT